MKIYTKTGDDGTTGLYDGTRCSKGDEIFELLGALDELSAHIGMLCALLNEPETKDNVEETVETKHITFHSLRDIQCVLLDIGSVIATPNKDLERIRNLTIKEEKVLDLEKQIDNIDAKIPPLRNFILAGVGKVDSQCHICRTVCRRAERELTRYFVYSPHRRFILETSLKYLNRLSDLFFIQARYYSGCREMIRKTTKDGTSFVVSPDNVSRDGTE